MPKHVQIRDVPDDVHAELRRRAAQAGMTLSEYLRREMTSLVERPTLDEVFARVRARGHGHMTLEDAAAGIREDRGPLP